MPNVAKAELPAVALSTRTVLQFGDVLILAAAAVILALPILLHGPIAVGHDTYEHLNYSKHFAEQFWGGELYPRWLLKMNHGLGSPSFFVYPPLPAYVYALLEPAGEMLHFNAFSAAEFLCLFASGLFAFLWLRTMATRFISIAVAILYMLIPYHLSVDLYRRTALAECWALTWMPLFLYCTVQVVNQKRPAAIALPIVYALLILSHVDSVLIFSLIPLILASTLAGAGRKMRATFSTAKGMLLGAGLSGFYLLSALSHARYFPVSMLSINLADEFLVFDRRLFLADSQEGFTRGLSLIVIDTVLFLAFCGVMTLWKGTPEQKKSSMFWLAVCVIPIFMMSSLSAPLWRTIPFLFDAVQYPWRFNIVLCLAAIPLAAFALSDITWPISFPHLCTLAVTVLFVFTWLVSLEVTLRRYNRGSSAAEARMSQSVSDDDGWFDAWKAPGMDQLSALKASMGPSARFLEGNGTATVKLWEPRHIELEADSANGGPLMINQFYYPEWRAESDPGGQPLPIKTALPEGLLELQVPPGRQQVRLGIPRGGSERIGDWISALCAFLWIFLAARSRRPVSPQSP